MCVLCGGSEWWGDKLSLTDAQPRTCGDVSTLWPFQMCNTCDFLSAPTLSASTCSVVLPRLFDWAKSLERTAVDFNWINILLCTMLPLFLYCHSAHLRTAKDWYFSKITSAWSQSNWWSLSHVIHLIFAFNSNLLVTTCQSKAAMASNSYHLLTMPRYTGTIK